MAEQIVTLNPGESKVVTFEVTPSEARAYQVAVNGLAGSFVATPPVPEVVLSNLVIEPSEVMVGERVYIRVTGTNYSDTYYKAKTVVFKIDGVTVEALTYNLAPGRSMEYVYSFIPFEAGTFTVEADGLYGSFVVIEMPPTDIELSNLIIIPMDPIAYERIYFKVTATNYGDVKESRQILCRFNGRVVMPQTVTLSPGESKVVTFSVMLFGPGTFTVVIDGLTESFEVI